VELEEPIPVMAGAGALQEAQPEIYRETLKEIQAEKHVTVQPSEFVAKPHSNPENRRVPRYACRLGAEVYRTGTTVPNHCCLTDLSPGGCYLELHLPFAKGTSVEITVRTHNMKLRVRGAVQAAHPGYGMGIIFDLQSKEERDQVQKLTDFVAANAETASS
jgi:PilZ domain-containing protein